MVWQNCLECDEGCIHEGYGMCMDEVSMCRIRLHRLFGGGGRVFMRPMLSYAVCVYTYISCRCIEAIVGYSQIDHLCSHVFAPAY